MSKSSLPQDIKQPSNTPTDYTPLKKDAFASESFAVPPSGNLRTSTERSSNTNDTKEINIYSDKTELTMNEHEYEELRKTNIIPRSPKFHNADEMNLIGQSSDENSLKGEDNLMFKLEI